MDFNTLKTHLKGLIKKKDEMEEELIKIKNSLDTLKVGVSSPLIDNEGFPVGNVDVRNVRTNRNRFAILQTDHVNLMREIEESMLKLHSMRKVDVPITPIEEENEGESQFDEMNEFDPFLLVDQISPTSPAESAGLRINDRIMKFGDIVKKDIKMYGLKALGSYVQNNKNKKVVIKVLRGNSILDLIFVPRDWKGRGLLGCHVNPL